MDVGSRLNRPLMEGCLCRGTNGTWEELLAEACSTQAHSCKALGEQSPVDAVGHIYLANKTWCFYACVAQFQTKACPDGKIVKLTEIAERAGRAKAFYQASPRGSGFGIVVYTSIENAQSRSAVVGLVLL